MNTEIIEKRLESEQARLELLKARYKSHASDLAHAKLPIGRVNTLYLVSTMDDIAECETQINMLYFALGK